MRYLRCILVLAPFLLAAAAPKQKPPYDYARQGNPPLATRPSYTTGVVLMGGGRDVDAAFQQMCRWNNGGDFLVLTVTTNTVYNPYIRKQCRDAGVEANSVATLTVPSQAAAQDRFVSETVAAANAIFITGGDQSDYINYWSGPGLQQALKDAIQNGVPVAGTSAGLNVLTQWVYPALTPQGVTSAQALQNPFSFTLMRDFVSIASLTGIIGDPHFVTRDRMGRDLAFLCQMYRNGVRAPRSIGVDEATALAIGEDGWGTVLGASGVYFLRAGIQPPKHGCEAGNPLTYGGIDVYRVGPGGTFLVNSAWPGGSGFASYTVSATAGVLSSSGNGDSKNIY